MHIQGILLRCRGRCRGKWTMRARRFTKKKGEEEVGCRLIGCVSAYAVISYIRAKVALCTDLVRKCLVRPGDALGSQELLDACSTIEPTPSTLLGATEREIGFFVDGAIVDVYGTVAVSFDPVLHKPPRGTTKEE